MFNGLISFSSFFSTNLTLKSIVIRSDFSFSSKFWNNEKDKSEEIYNNILPLINFENRQCGFRATKTVMKEGGVIKSDFCRDPIKPLDQDTKNLLLNFAKRYDLLTYKWGK